MFATYPDEWQGAGLLLLRMVIGALLMERGVSLLLGWRDLNLTGAVIAVVSAACATLLLTGYFTRFAAALVATASAGSLIFWHSLPSIGVFDIRLTASLVGAIAAALACLGPGAFSLDARLFGRQEIVFPDRGSSH